ncbi:MAG: hypothetical protein EOP83_23835 [Verrucomicrobiaceae bacterium]|nr:MAG: hypothetical protein EOP83_23835 [Verrucomicrobiaceae bacterium]
MKYEVRVLDHRVASLARTPVRTLEDARVRAKWVAGFLVRTQGKALNTLIAIYFVGTPEEPVEAMVEIDSTDTWLTKDVSHA